MPIKKLFVSAGIFNYIKISSDSMPNILYRCQTCILLVKTHAKLLHHKSKFNRVERLKINEGMIPVKKYFVAITSPILQHSPAPLEFLLKRNE